ncbi:type III secretion system effector protein HopAB1 [Pseudomonas amygdali]|uniref:type III secretion system effector protein HopAB1 n=1 Tax=Pseudomonas amygdali TaxID=47877 RepID=UPI0006B9A477|nr:type III secretion system effector protein HopAB1 [Pseudomonas amygdali]KPB60684.1 Effector protein hopAB1 [Pseudomonas amygdali pv. myricae]KWS56193.1 Effector protein hopAB1 [Pseudomonas amygdali pv. myricae]RMT53461.1 Effector protein hopAB1 [Pseudomonas amygdali pv. myricae]RMU98606.1 Effector protein hopAB1 [Pseudomonas amygdali pv. myricae]RMV28374.1 Effector protein hopAB1 [Pseudomonas amygdali pv. myricae]
MPGINGAGPSNFFWQWRTDGEPVTEREHDSSRSASSANSPELPPPASPAESGRQRLLRSSALSRQTREWLEATPARVQGANPPAEARQSPEAEQAERIVQELVRGGADLNNVRTMLRNVMDNNAVAFSRVERDILLQHFPNMPMTGISSDSVLANELRQRLRQTVRQQRALVQSSTPARLADSSSGSSQRSLIGRSTMLMTPGRSSSSSAAASRTSVDRHPQGLDLESARLASAARHNHSANQTNEALRRLTQEGVDMERLRTSLGRYIMSLEPLPPDLRRALESVGINPFIPEELSLVDHPVLNFSAALNRMLASRQTTTNSPELPPLASSAESGRRRLLRSPPLLSGQREWIEQNMRQEAEPQSSRLNRAVRLAVMPPQKENEDNVAYAIRLRRLNPGADVSRVVASFITDPAARQQVVDDIRAALDIAPQFSQLRTISKADAESEELGFRDAADHPDNATSCLFGEELSLSNPDQQVIGLAVNPTDKPQPYSQEVNKALTFMDMKKLAQYLADKPEHPLNRQRLDAKNIAKYAFKIVP